MTISIIAAVGANGAIGRERDLPWAMPADMHFFTQTTLHHHVIMGRKSFEDIVNTSGKPLAGRTNVVITRNPEAYRNVQTSLQASLTTETSTVVVGSLGEAIALARRSGETEAFIIGGAEIFALGLEIADRLYITRIHAVFEADTFFPQLPTLTDNALWRETQRKDYPADAENQHPYSFTRLERV
jgi:dihydrofolate reductase